MNEQEARAAITVEHMKGYVNRWGVKYEPTWDLITPDGWCWEPNRHTNICHSKAQADRERRYELIYPCAADCEVCGAENQ